MHLAREPVAVTAAEEGIALAQETGQTQWEVASLLAKATIAAERGDLDATETLPSGRSTHRTDGRHADACLVQFTRERGAVAHQRYAEGLEHLRKSLDPTDPAFHPFIGAWGLSDLVEACARTDQPTTADAYLKQLESLNSATFGSFLRATAGYAGPIVADDDTAEALYASALGTELANWPCYRGRMLLLYGRWLRRQRRAAESRVPLRSALDGFEALAFAELGKTARQELRASGDTPRSPAPNTWSQLTPQELQIAQLASLGYTNRDIAQRLYLSPAPSNHTCIASSPSSASPPATSYETPSISPPSLETGRDFRRGQYSSRPASRR